MRLRRLLLTAVLVISAVAVSCLGTASGTAASPAGAAGRHPIRTPGSMTGYAFDTCVSPSNAVMNRWWRASPYSAVGFYLSGAGRACPARRQPHLSPAWVRHQHAVGWRILPLHVGLQAPCFQAGDHTPTKPRMSAHRPTAHRQGRHAARQALRAAARYRIGRGSTLYLDVEWYDRSRTTCNRAVLSFIDGWTRSVHAARFRSGVYSSASAAIEALDVARHHNRDRYRWPDQLWAGCSVCRPVGDLTPFLRGTFWRGHSRLHQYRLDVRATYGGTTYPVDTDWVDVGAGSVAHTQTHMCRGRLSWHSYPRLSHGKEGGRVRTAQCLLTHQGFFHARLGYRYGAGVVRAVRRLQAARGLPVSGVLTRRAWVSLLAAGTRPVLKIGSDRPAVWRVQRTLVAIGAHAPITGVFGHRTTHALRAWQRRVDIAHTGVIGPRQWRLLRHGRGVHGG